MANGHIEIHDPFSNGHADNTSHDPKTSSDTASMADTVEYRILMAYATRRCPKKKDDSNLQNGGGSANGDVTTPSQTLIETGNKGTEEKIKNKKKKKQKKKGWKRVLGIISCISPRTQDEEEQQPREPDYEVGFRCLHPKDEDKKEDGLEDKMGEMVSRLMDLADEIEFSPPELETDAQDDDLEKVIGLLLRENGDRWNETVLKDANIAGEIFWNYSFFRALINNLLTRMGLRASDPNTPGPQASPKTQIAVMCEVTSRLSTQETMPTNRLLDHGARYMQDYYSPWAQEQGGYDEAFAESDEEVD